MSAIPYAPDKIIINSGGSKSDAEILTGGMAAIECEFEPLGRLSEELVQLAIEAETADVRDELATACGRFHNASDTYHEAQLAFRDALRKTQHDLAGKIDAHLGQKATP